MARRAWLIGALVAAGAVAWLSFDAKGFVEGRLADGLGRDVRIESLDYDLGIVTRVHLTDLQVAGAAADQAPMASIRDIDMRVALWPLLRDELVIEDLRVRDGKLRLGEDDLGGAGAMRLVRLDNADFSSIAVHFSQGGREVDVWLERLGATRDGARTSLSGSGTAGAAPDKLAAFEVEGTLGHPAAVTGADSFDVGVTATLADARVDFEGKVSAEKMEGVARVDAPELSDLLRLAGIEMALIGPVKGTAKLTGQGDALAARDVDVAVGREGGALLSQVTGRIDDVMALRGVDLAFQAVAPDVVALAPLLGQRPALDGRLDAQGRIVDSDGKLAVADLNARLVKPDHHAIDVTGTVGALPFGDANLALSGSIRQSPQLPAAMVPHGPYAVSGKLKGDLGKLALADLKVENDAAAAVRVRASGAIGDVLTQSDVRIEATVTAPSLAALDAALPGDSGAVSAEMKVTPGADGAIEVSGATFKVGEMTLTGKAAYRPEQTLTGEFHAPHLVLDKLLGTGGQGQRVFSETPLPLAALAGVDADVALIVDKISIGDHVGEKLVVRLVASDGMARFNLEPFAFDGGEIGATMEVDATATPPAVRLEGRGSGVNLAAISAFTKQPTALTGRADVDIRVAGRGASARAIAAGLAGEVAMVAANGTIESELVNLIAADLATEIFSQATDSRANTPLQCLLADFSIHRGLADAKALFLSTDKIIVTGEGRVNLGEEQYDLSLLPAPKDPSLFSLAQRVNVTGPLTDPSVTPDAGSLAWSAVQALVGNALLPGAGLLLPMLSTGNGDEHPCASEVRAMPKKKDVVDKATDAASGAAKAVGKAADTVGDAVGGAVKGLGKLFE